ncbi:MAG: hypothetical protein LBR38_02840 [Synergistaceae bacterium]|nr:hypothetical protein [Synergistaceae bacterium]
MGNTHHETPLLMIRRRVPPAGAFGIGAAASSGAGGLLASGGLLTDGLPESPRPIPHDLGRQPVVLRVYPAGQHCDPVRRVVLARHVGEAEPS